MSTLLKLGLSGYDVKPRFFVRSNANISYKIHFFFGEKIVLGGGVHGKVCWLIAYMLASLIEYNIGHTIVSSDLAYITVIYMT